MPGAPGYTKAGSFPHQREGKNPRRKKVICMEFKTAISKMTDDDLIIHGKKHSEMVDSWGFPKTIFFLLSGKEPSEAEAAVFDAMLTTVIDHGMGVASALTSRFVMSTGNPLNAAVAGGVLCLGDYHGGSIEKAMKLYAEVKESGKTAAEFVKDAFANKKLLFGFGHKVYKDKDPRTSHLAEICKKNSYTSKYLTLALDMEKAIEAEKGKRLVLNVDGAIAALLLEMGFDPAMGKGFFIIGRTPSLVAQAVEEKAREKPVRRVSEDDIVYDGK